jgi:hemerythrin-like domain-containing protein
MKHSSLQIIRDEHAALAAMLQSMQMMVRRGPGAHPQQFFEVLRAMLFYIDEFPERLHHPKESEYLFPRVLQAVPGLREVIAQLDAQHQEGERMVHALQHHLQAWEFLGETRREGFTQACQRFVDFYQAHMHLEETVVLPEAKRALSDADWAALDAAFALNRDPLGGQHPVEPLYERLFTHIVNEAPAPIGLGAA